MWTHIQMAAAWNNLSVEIFPSLRQWHHIYTFATRLASLAVVKPLCAITLGGNIRQHGVGVRGESDACLTPQVQPGVWTTTQRRKYGANQEQGNQEDCTIEHCTTERKPVIIHSLYGSLPCFSKHVVSGLLAKCFYHCIKHSYCCCNF